MAVTSTLVVMLASGIDDGKGRQKAIEAEAQVHLCCGLAPPVLRPVHAVGYQLHHGRVHRMEAHLEAVQQRAPGIASRPLTPKTAIMVLKMGQRAPEDQLGELRVAHLVGVGEVVARGRREAKSGDGARLEPQPVADIIEAQRMGKLGEKHRAQVAEHGIGPGFDIDSCLPGCPVDDVTRNELEHLPENIDMVTWWLSGVSVC